MHSLAATKLAFRPVLMHLRPGCVAPLETALISEPWHWELSNALELVDVGSRPFLGFWLSWLSFDILHQPSSSFMNLHQSSSIFINLHHPLWIFINLHQFSFIIFQTLEEIPHYVGMAPSRGQIRYPQEKRSCRPCRHGHCDTQIGKEAQVRHKLKQDDDDFDEVSWDVANVALIIAK